LRSFCHWLEGSASLSLSAVVSPASCVELIVLPAFAGGASVSK